MIEKVELVANLIKSVRLIVVQQSAVDVFYRVGFVINVGEVGIRVDLQHVDAVAEDSSEHHVTNLFHLLGDKSINVWLFNCCVVVTAEIFLPRFWVATVAASASKRSRHFIFVRSVR